MIMSDSDVQFTAQEALLFHSQGRPGKIEIVATKPMATQRDLSLAYSPGVAVPVQAIADDPATAYDYTAKGNLVAVISNGTAILGMGNLGALASKPVMEGKAVLFKRFADVDSIDIEVNTEDAQRFIDAVELLEPTFGGINLEDIAAPDCFVIEQTLRERMNIPVFHDDQHGTAIISAAGLINACHADRTRTQRHQGRLQRRGRGGDCLHRIDQGDGRAARQCHHVRPQRRDLSGPHRGHGPMEVGPCGADRKARTLAEAMVGADVFLGLSAANVMTKDMVRSMAPQPIIFAMANPDPEITPPDAMEARPDAIVATGPFGLSQSGQ